MTAQEAKLINDIATKWQWGDWANVLLPEATKNPIDNAQRVTDWLRQKAKEVEGKP